MFSLNLGHRWNLAAAVEGIRSSVFLSAGNSSEKLTRSPHPDGVRILLDPQLYLSGLDASACAKTCARLATFPWFDVDGIEPFDSNTSTRTDWERSVREDIASHWTGSPPEGKRVSSCARACVELQARLGASAIILPTPLIAEREDEAETQARWLDAGLASAEAMDIGQPLIATVALAESVLSERSFRSAGFLDAVVDQVTARDGVSGAYIVIAQNEALHPFSTPAIVRRAYLRLCHSFDRAGVDLILPNFADVHGLVCMAAGASGFATGPSQSTRRLSLSAFKDSTGGKVFPYFYSHPTATEWATETDLDEIVKAKLVRRIADRTPYSKTLIETLERNGSASELANWAESQNKVDSANKHFLYRLAQQAHDMAQLSASKRATRCKDWLEGAAANLLLIEAKLKDVDLKIRSVPALDWQEELESVLES